MKKQLMYTMNGVGIGSFAYHLCLLSLRNVSRLEIVSVLVMSGLIGCTAQVYELKVSLQGRVGLHLVTVLAIESLMLLVNGIFNTTALLLTVLIYLLAVASVLISRGKRGESHA